MGIVNKLFLYARHISFILFLYAGIILYPGFVSTPFNCAFFIVFCGAEEPVAASNFVDRGKAGGIIKGRQNNRRHLYETVHKTCALGDVAAVDVVGSAGSGSGSRDYRAAKRHLNFA